MKNPVQRVQQLGQSVWYDNMRRALLTSGELQRLMEIGVTGLTSNPTIFEKAIGSSSDYDASLLELAISAATTRDAYESLALGDIRAAADLLLPVHSRTQGRDGYASLEVDPGLSHDTEQTVVEARHLFQSLARPNVMIKVPATPEGVLAIRCLISEGINVNVTLIFSLDAYAEVMEAYLAGLEDLGQSGGDVSRVASVASFFVSRVDTAVDGLLEQAIAAGHPELRNLLGRAAIANARLAYDAFHAAYATPRARELLRRGARPQRPLWASTGTKNPAYSDVLYVDSLVAWDTVNTMPPQTLSAFLDHGTAVSALDSSSDEAAAVIASLEAAGIGMKEVTDRLLAEGLKSFADSFDALLQNVNRKKTALLRRPRVLPSDAVDEPLGPIRTSRVIARLWQRDHTLWSPSPGDITDRLGWLHSPQDMAHETNQLVAFAHEVKEAGFRQVVLLGMGGSSLGPEVLWRTFGSRAGYPGLVVLDSIVPSAVQAVTGTIDVAQTLFLVSSKSGSTIESLSLYKHFRGVAARAVGQGKAGGHFVAITDRGTRLEAMAREGAFRRTFINASDIGGRYSVLSFFGLVPAALCGVDIGLLVRRSLEAVRECGVDTVLESNPGANLGASIAQLALSGRDKLTFVSSPAIESFGLWAEQLIAESLGKDGKGIVPVVGEPLLDPSAYGSDRVFVRLRLIGDDNGAQDAAVASLESAGNPVLHIGLSDRYDLGAEFFRWELATAIVATRLGVHPFDQPDVEIAKDLASRMLTEGNSQSGGQRRATCQVSSSTDSLAAVEKLLASARPGDYFAALAYVRETPEMDRALAEFRQAVMQRLHVATTCGYGPRYLHSTGQLHKGGRDLGLFLLVTAEQCERPVSSGSHSFNDLSRTQAWADLRALSDRGRRVVHVHLATEDPEAVRRMAVGVASATAGLSPRHRQ